MKKTTKKKSSKAQVAEFRPYRVLFLVVVVGVTCIVLFAALGVTSGL
ncbi:MAG TPA: hypothetical protein PLN95_02030 [Candidatus Saccharibacteria bacterium]|nr:hypothetical protein [Candidatus Saccharibacteria bacterium]